jgi:hypothetical protein
MADKDQSLNPNNRLMLVKAVDFFNDLVSPALTQGACVNLPPPRQMTGNG